MTLLFMLRGKLLLVLLEAPTLPSTMMTSVMAVAKTNETSAGPEMNPTH
jgi:hypothetical protein